MFDFLSKENSSVKKIWLVVALSVLFIVTLPIMIFVLPVVVAIDLTGDLLSKKDNKRKVPASSLFAEGDLFNKWTGFFNVNKPEGWD